MENNLLPVSLCKKWATITVLDTGLSLCTDQVSTTIQNWMPRNTITLSMRLETNVNLGKKESKIRSAPNSENKIKIGVRSVHHPHPHPPLLGSLEHLVEVLYLLAQAYFITIQYITVLQHYHIY